MMLPQVLDKASVSLTELLDVKYLLTGLLAWGAARAYSAVDKVVKLVRWSETVDGQMEAMAKAIAEIRKGIDEGTSSDAVQNVQIARLGRDVDAAHEAIRGFRGNPPRQAGNDPGSV